MLAIALHLFPFIANAQCPDGDRAFNSQADIAAFAIAYSSCADITVNNLIIGYEAGGDNSDITDLTPLANIKTVTGSIIIRRATNLTTLNGLDNVTSFSGDLRIEKCYTLTDITALSGITQARHLNIRDNNVLPNLDGLHNLAQITGSGSGSGYLYFFNNAKLANVNALQNLTTIGNYIQIEQNSLLQNLNGLSGVTAINGNIVIRNNVILENISGLKNIAASSISESGSGLIIKDNPELAVCNLPNFGTYLSGPGNRTINGNKSTCIDVPAVVATCSCSTPSLVAYNFFNTQAELDEFGALYGSCSEITLGNVVIGYGGGSDLSDITDLSPLANVKTITGYLGMRNNQNLISLDELNGFPALTSIGEFLTIQDNANLKKINGFPALKSIGTFLGFYNHLQLENISGFPVLESIGTYLHTQNNTELKTVSGFGSLNTVGTQTGFNENPELTEISGFGSLTSVGGSFWIRNASDLATMSAFGSLTSVGDEFWIQKTALANLDNFSNLTTLGGSKLAIEDNSQLTDISGLANVNPATIGGSLGLFIANNPELAVCNLPNFCAYLSGPGARTISGNKTTCTDEQAIVTACADMVCASVSGMSFTFTTQAQLDEFRDLYGHCADITLGNVSIGELSDRYISDIIDLTPLVNVKTITGYLRIENNQNLLSLDGLNTLESVGLDFHIWLNCQLDNITGFSDLIGIGGDFYVANNDNLEEISGFSALKSVGGISIIHNTKLTEFNGFSALTSMGTALILSGNAALKSIDGFSALTSIGTGINLSGNAGLKSIDGFSALTTIGGGVSIFDNAELMTISGFNNISSLGNTSRSTLWFKDNPKLTEISGFSSLASLKGELEITNNPALAVLTAFGSLSSIGDQFRIENTALTHLDNFSNLTALGYSTLAIEGNKFLTDISGLKGIESFTIGAGIGLSIVNNENLSVCSLPNFCNYLSGRGARTISGNKGNCLDEQAVVDRCLLNNINPDNDNILYVNSNVWYGSGSGRDWTNAIPELSAALKWAKEQYHADNTVFDINPLRIYVARGAYKPLYRADNLNGSNPQDRDNAFVLVKNVQVYGGFAGFESRLERRNYLANPTILSGDIDAVSGLSANDAYHIVISAGDVGSALLDGFTVSGGYSTSPDGNTGITVNATAIRYERGSGLSIVNSSPQIRNTVFTGNRAYAGAVSHTNGNATFVNTLFTGNTAQLGTVYNNLSSPVFVNCTFSGNTGTTTANDGVAMRNVTSHPEFYNTIVWSNHTSNGNINNIFNSGGGNPTSIPVYHHSLVQGITTTSNGNFQGDTDPMFTDAANGDYRPEAGSPVINAGDNTYFDGLETGSRDLAGNPRLLRHHIDLGAYESDCGGATLVSNAEISRPLTTGDNYLYNSCDLLAVVSPENANGPITVSTVSEHDLIDRKRARYVRRYYQISAEDTGNTDVTLFFTQADFDHYNSTFGDQNYASLPGNLRVARHSGAFTVAGSVLSADAAPEFIDNVSTLWNETLGLWEVTFTTPGFSGFFITGQSDAALPVTLVDFTAKAAEESALLEWHTAGETNTSRYEIQRSTDGRLWQTIGEVAAAGESDAPLAYHYRDARPLSGLSYYRLKMIDRAGGSSEGAYTYSGIRSILVDKAGELLVYPNPTTDRVYVEAGGEIKEVLLWDIAGRLVKKQRYEVGAGISLDGLGSGMLLVEVRLADGTSRIGRVVVQP